MLSLRIRSEWRVLLVSSVRLLLIAVAPIRLSMSPMRFPLFSKPGPLLAEDSAGYVVQWDHRPRAWLPSKEGSGYSQPGGFIPPAAITGLYSSA